MNYKIKVTPENREAIKDIANRNGMNEIGFNFDSPNPIYHIEKGCFTTFPIPQKNSRNYQGLTFEQFKAMFDKQESDLEKWIRETKAKNLSLEELKNYIFYDMSNIDFNELRKKLGLKQGESLAQALLKKWNEPKEEWQPKRGDRVLVWNEGEEENEKVYYDKIGKNTIVFLDEHEFNDFNNDKTFILAQYQHMKPLPIAPTEPEKTFKDKIIELAEKRIEHYKICEKESRENSDEHDAIEYKAIYNQFEDFLYKIKELN